MNTLLALATIAFLPSSGRTSDPNIDDFVQAGLQDVKLVASISKGDQKELAKINKDFGLAYLYEHANISYKEPFMMRVEFNSAETRLLYTIKGTIQTMKLAGIKRGARVDLSARPGRRQTTLDIGLLTSALMGSFLDAKYVSEDKETSTSVFDLTYKQSDVDKSRFRVWLDKTKKLIVKREWYNQTGALIATFNYLAPTQVNKIWFPSKMEVLNGEGKTAGITNYQDVVVNSGLPDSLFEG